MAKVKSPLMSFSASGQIAKSLVFATWKGIADVRQYVIPANPRSTDQVTQRGYLTAAVAAWHAFTRNVYDAAAFNILASLEASAMSGFNIFCKLWIAVLKAAETPHPCHTFAVITNTGGLLDFDIEVVTGLTMKYQIGLSPSVLGPQIALTEDGATGNYQKVGQVVVAGNDYYIKMVCTTGATVAVSGIYKVRALA